MFWHRERIGPVELAVTDARTDLGTDPSAAADPAGVGAALGVARVAAMRQVHGADVALADPGGVPVADALVVERPGIAALVRVADCVPVVLASPSGGLAAVVHAGRVGMTLGVVPATVRELRRRGASDLRAWIGPHACAHCYEVPQEMADEAERRAPGAASSTSWGTPSIDLGAGVGGQLRALGVDVTEVSACTIEDTAFHSYRRQGAGAGRFGMLVTLHEEAR